MVENISISKLHQHPDNPRADLGDLTELAASIKENGVLQNLTVVPTDYPDEWNDEYFVVIGNRRLEAAKIAGLEELPCNVQAMSHQDQLATMLMENMQREDLTPIEEAHGFQLMMDLGLSIADLSERTGLSETTIRHRTKLNDLDQELLQDVSEERNVTITDLIKLEGIHDLDTRNKVLEYIGTPNFDWYVTKAIDNEKHEEVIKEMKEYLSLVGVEVDREDSVGKKFVRSLYISSADEKEVGRLKDDIGMVVEDLGPDKALYYSVSGWSIMLFKDASEDEEEEPAMSEEEMVEEQRRKERKEVYRIAMEKTDEFVDGLTEAGVKRNIDRIVAASVDALRNGRTIWNANRKLAELFRLEAEEPDEEISNVTDFSKAYPYKALAGLLYVVRRPTMFPCNYSGEPLDHVREEWQGMYDLLAMLGYEASDEEKQIADGTHRLFVQPEEDECAEYDDGEYDDEYDEDYDFEEREEAI